MTKQDQPPAFSMSAKPCRTLPGPARFSRLAGVLSYMFDPVGAQLSWMADKKLGSEPAIGACRGDATVVVVMDREGVRELSARPEVWVRPESAVVRTKPGTKPHAVMRTITTSNGPEWKDRHRNVNGSLRGASALADYVAGMTETAGEWSRRIARNGVCDLMGVGVGVALDNMWSLLFGEPVDGAELAATRRRVDGFVDDILAGAISPLNAMLPYDLPWLPYRRWLRATEGMYEWAAGVAQRKLDAGDESSVAGRMVHRRAQEGSVNVADVVGDLMALYITGRDGPGAAIAWTLFLLAAHPRVQAKLSDQLATGDQSYLDAVINESLRILPPTFVLNPRIAARDASLCGHAVPRGAMVFGSILARHHDPGAWSMPGVFLPERWLHGRPAGPYDFIPFGQGQRRCIGDQFAMTQTRISVARLARDHWFEIDPDDEFGIKVDAVLMTPSRGASLYVGSRPATPRESVPVRGSVSRIVHRLGGAS